MSENTKFYEELAEKVFNDRTVRKTVIKESHYWFFYYYFAHYVAHPTADFQREMFGITEDQNNRLAVIVAFRGSAKSTIMTLSYPIWAILGKQQKKFVLILSQTQSQAKQHMANLRKEFESNRALKKDLGPFSTHEDVWGSTTIVLSKYDARITIASSEQSIRGVRHGAFRPDLIICDDVEDLPSVKTRESRDKTYSWLTSEVIPAGGDNTKIVIVGNLLHEDSLLMRLKNEINRGQRNGLFKEYPLITDQGEILWPGRFSDKAAMEDLKRMVANDSAWHREYLLKIIDDQSRVIQKDWIHYYDELPSINDVKNKFRFAATGIDLAISEKTTADYTAMVSAFVYGWDNDMKIYILPHPVNERLHFPATFEKAKNLSDSLVKGTRSKLYIEDVQYQRALVQALQEAKYPAEGVKVHGQDKTMRLSVLSHPIKQKQVLFPTKGAEQLIEQLVGFGIEKHDDLADALAILIGKIIEGPNSRPICEIMFLDGGGVVSECFV